VLRLEAASAGYGRIQIIDGLSLELPAGGVLAVIGPNGAGKSTLMRLICGSAPVRKGGVLFDGTDIAALTVEERGELGIVLCPEGRHIFASLSVEENLLIGASPLRRRLGREHRAAVRSGLERSYAMFPILKERRSGSGGALSGGQQQMLAIARALMARPRLLLLDEPSLGLSPVMADDVYRHLAGLKADGLTMVIVEEAAGRPLALAGRGIVMRGGRIVRQGAATALAADGDLGSAYLGAPP
jgi:branched-chain amino acid transport system ATP-binding protein